MTRKLFCEFSLWKENIHHDIQDLLYPITYAETRQKENQWLIKDIWKV